MSVQPPSRGGETFPSQPKEAGKENRITFDPQTNTFSKLEGEKRSMFGHMQEVADALSHFSITKPTPGLKKTIKGSELKSKTTGVKAFFGGNGSFASVIQSVRASTHFR